MSPSLTITDCPDNQQKFNSSTTSALYSGHPQSQTPTELAKKFKTANVRDSRKFKILAFCEALGKPNTIFMTLVSLNGNRRENIAIFLK